MRALLFTILVGLTQNLAYAATDHCSDWERVPTSDRTCIFAGKDGVRWERVCTDPELTCHRRHWEHGVCDSEDICLSPKTNPNLLTSTCTEWVRHNGVDCTNEQTGRQESEWVRACQQAGIPTSICTNQNPNL